MERVIDIKKNNHQIKVTVRDNIIEVMTILPEDLYFMVIMGARRNPNGDRFDYERFVINDFMRHIFNESKPFMHQFTYAQEMSDYMTSKGLKCANDNNNGWFKTICFDINVSNSVNDILAYIEKKSKEFETKSYRLP